jgi:SAM-dependent methyltransferase
MESATLYEVWWQEGTDGDQRMEDSHHVFWRKVIEMIVETDLRHATILDFGCNQGGFLRLLYTHRPFQHGVGVDLARQSIAVANQRKGYLPITYNAAATLQPYAQCFDLAVSTAVVYLLADLPAHAREIKQALKPGGVYYATFTDYTGNPSFASIRDTINRHGTVTMQPHTLDDIAQAFHGVGFQVSLRRMTPAGYIPLSFPDRTFLCLADRMQYEYTQAYIFRCVAPSQETGPASDLDS